MRIVGKKIRPEIELDPVEAFRRARNMDKLFQSVDFPRSRGVFRGSHAHFNRLDADRQMHIARLLNRA
jgi:hypothetical protein